MERLNQSRPEYPARPSVGFAELRLGKRATLHNLGDVIREPDFGEGQAGKIEVSLYYPVWALSGAA